MQLTLYIGHNIGNEQNALSHEHIVKQCKQTLKLSGLTAWTAYGYYDDNPEETSVIRVNGLSIADIKQIDERVQTLSAQLRQECIYRSVAKTDDMFIYANAETVEEMEA